MTKHLRIFMLTLLTIVCALEGYAQETATLTFKEACNGKGTDDQKGEWVITSDSKESQFDSSRGIHYGTSKATVSYLKATSSSYSDKKITKIVVNSSAANSGSPKINCTVGGKAFGETYNLTATNAAYSFNGEATGEIVVNISKTESTKALYLLSVAVTFEDTATPPTTTTTFGANSGKTFTFTNGKLDGFTTPTATATKSDDNTDLSNLIEYTSSDADIVTVNSKTGELTFTNTKFGKATITATLPKTDTYQTSTDSYFVENTDNHIATSLSFNGTDITLTEGKTDAGADFTGYTATEANNIAGTVTYAASGDAVATVNETTGTITVTPSVYGTTTITATFTPADQTQYLSSTATYQITNKKAVDLSEITFDVTIDKTSKKDTKEDQLMKSIVKIESTSAALGGYGDYRFYSGSKTTISLTDPTRVITSIKFVGGSTYGNFTTDKPNYDKNTGTWTGYEESVVFTASPKVNSVTQIIVTTAEKKPAPALSFAEPTVTKNLNESDGIISLQTISKPADLDASAITYKSSDNKTAEVEDGNIYMFKTGTVTITATSVETDKYAAGTASYKLVIVDPSSAETKSVTFIAGQQMGTQNANGKKDEMSLDGVTVSSTNAALAASSTLGEYTEYTYRFYMQSQTTISTKVGKITEIHFVGSGNKNNYSLKNLSSTDKNYTSTQDDYGVWTGSAKEVVFKASPQVRAVLIIVTIAMPKSYTFDETSTQNVIENCSYANVTLKRTVESSHWNTFCVPFSLTADQVTKYFGEGTLLRTYEGDFNNNIANFKVVDNIEAGKPYLLKPGNAVVENPTFEEVSIVATNLDTYKNPQAVGDAAMFQMKGIYNHVTLAQNETNLYLGEGNLFYYPADAEACEMNGLRAYFIVPENTDINKLRANIDGTATSLGAIFNTEENNAPVYNLQGQRVGNSLGSLKSGIYIKNGKKVVVK